MKKIAFLLLLTSFQIFSQHNIIPEPANFEYSDVKFILSNKLNIKILEGDKDVRTYVSNFKLFLENAGINVSINSSNKKLNSLIMFLSKTKIEDLGNEGYALEVHKNSIYIAANKSAGIFNGLQTLRQLLPTDFESNTYQLKNSTEINGCKIMDYPRFHWRGLMLDVSRHFFTVAEVKQYIDKMSQYKLNVFHWHLTDDEGWRIEIKKYPLLTQVGAKRGPGTKLPFSIFSAMRGAKNRVQSGYYTQADIREVVAYAKDRSIEILPEIDIPGHSKAAVIAYPTLLQDPQDTSIYRSVQKVRNNTINPAMESSYVFLENVLSEVSSLFPFAYIHLGGDEVPRGAPEKSPAVKKLMKKQNLMSTHKVENYFFTRMDKILKKYNKKMIAWQEVLQGKPLLRKENIFMAWKNTKSGYRAMKKHRNIIMSPVQYLYFDQQYIRSNNEPGHTWSTPVSTQKAYSFKPQKSRYLKGLHACLWSETMLNEKIVDYLAWPRIFALSEIAWAGEKNHHWKTFQKRASGIGLKRLKVQGVHYRAIVPIE